jgi:hypothetical protein
MRFIAKPFSKEIFYVLFVITIKRILKEFNSTSVWLSVWHDTWSILQDTAFCRNKLLMPIEDESMSTSDSAPTT